MTLRPRTTGDRDRPHHAAAVTRAHGAAAAFTLVELLVVVSIILVLVSILAAAVAGARGSQKRTATAILIGKLNTVIQQQYSTYGSRNVPSANATERGVALRKLASAELPDSWADVAYLWNNTDLFFVTPPSGTLLFPKTQLSGPQRSYISIWNGLSPAQRTARPAQFGDAECLFMVVMQGGIANCLDCGSLKAAEIGDKDNDGAMEFQDDWGNPIRFVLWPAGLELPPGSGRFFSASPPFSAGQPLPALGGSMRPLIFSGGADQTNSIQANAGGNIAMGANCGNPANITFGALDASAGDGRADNITNFDAEVAK